MVSSFGGERKHTTAAALGVEPDAHGTAVVAPVTSPSSRAAGSVDACPEGLGAVPNAIGILGVGALASAMVLALQRAWPGMRFHLSPRNAQAVAILQQQLDAVVHADNQSVADACQTLIVGVRPAQLQALADAVQFSPHHHLLLLSAGTPLAYLQALFAPARVTRLMTGLAVQGGGTAISCYPPDRAVRALWQSACATVIPFDKEAQFEASVLAVCANAWWLDQLDAMCTWLVQTTGMPMHQAQALLASNMSDVAQMLARNPDKSPAELARFIGSPGTYTGLGLDHLQAVDAHQPWREALALAFARMRLLST